MTRREFSQVMAAAAAAPISFDEANRTFVIDNGVVRKELRLAPNGRLRPSYLGLRGGRDWAVPATRWGTGICTKSGDAVSFGPSGPYVRHEILPDELRLYFGETGGLQTVLHIRVLPDLPVLEQWVEVRNGGSESAVIERFDPLLEPFAVPASAPCRLHYVQGCQDYGYGRGIGSTLQPFGPFRFRRVPLEPEDSRTLLNTAPNYANARRSTSSSENLNWFSFESAGDGVFGGLQWSGEWSLTFARSGPELLIQGGVNYFSRSLAPGEVLESPKAFLGFHTGGVDEGVHALHRYLRAHVVPAPPDAAFPWTCYNTWYNWSIGLEEQALKAEARSAARLGIECFYLDAGWWTGSPASGGFGKALGTWTENREKFPSGIASFAGFIHGLGMKFGFWVEPERIDSTLIGQGPDPIRESWIARRDGADLARNDGTRQLCFGCPEAVEWITKKLVRAAEEYHADWLKWDHNFYMPCNRADHGHQAGDGGFAHVQGVYKVLGTLRDRFPKLVIENCSGGGNRMDFGMMRYTQTYWTSDDTAPSYRVRYHSLGCSYPFPAQYQNSWYIGARKRSPEAVTADSPAEFLDYLFRSRMIGAFGISDRFSEWPPNVAEAARRAVAEYKRMRPVLTGGDVHHLLPQPLIWTPPLAAPREYEAIEYFHPGLNRGVVLAFRANVAAQAPVLKLRGLKPAARYRVVSASSGIARSGTGAGIMRDGVRASLPRPYTSDILWIDPA
ncbi:MAG: alpha-galactosidase [Bryobacteraceae bacterium]